MVPSFSAFVNNPSESEKWAWCADWLAIAVAAALPWSTSLAIILIGLWFIALLATRNFAPVFAEIATPVGGLPIALCLLGLIGMSWADVSWNERLAGLSPFHRLLAIPFLLAQFRRSDRALEVLIAFLASCTLLLLVSWSLVLLPNLPWRGKSELLPGIPVKDLTTQAQVFTLCAFGLFEASANYCKAGRHHVAGVLTLLGLTFLANVLYVAPSRTTLATIPLLLVLLTFLRLGWKGAVVALAFVGVLATLAWHTSPALRYRVALFEQDIRQFDRQGQNLDGTTDVAPLNRETILISAARASTRLRLEFWSKSLVSIAEAPAFGHGTGSIRDQFRRAAAGQTGISAEVTSNPHNQVLAVGIQLGLVGIIVLVAMWTAHLLPFWRSGWPAVIGLIVVVQNIVGSMFNAHLFDFTQGWIYVWGVGILARMAQPGAGTLFREASDDRVRASKSRMQTIHDPTRKAISAEIAPDTTVQLRMGSPTTMSRGVAYRAYRSAVRHLRFAPYSASMRPSAAHLPLT